MIYFDTEYNDTQVLVLCALKVNKGDSSGELFEFDLRNEL